MTTLSMSTELLEQLRAHLASSEEEQVAFLYCKGGEVSDELSAVGLYAVPPEGFLGQSAHHVALTDSVRAEVIPRAWELGGALVEAHSHPGARWAAFSPTDLLGFEEWVPHVRWRLRGAPYVALVFAERGYDALLWAGAGSEPGPLVAITSGDEMLQPSNLTLAEQR